VSDATDKHKKPRVGRLRKRLALTLLLMFLGSGAAIVLAHDYVQRHSAGLVYDDIAAIPQSRVGLVLGCAKTLSNGQGNLFFLFRMQAAAELYHAGKVKYLLVSGSNPTISYDESTDMMNALIRLGVPEDRIYRDYAGFRTFDSMVRAQKVFGLNECVVISQEFHIKRALCIANSIGLDCHAYSATGVALPHGFKTLAREKLARVKLLLDLFVLPTKPKFLGEPITIG
jgi:SanA protein